MKALDWFLFQKPFSISSICLVVMLTFFMSASASQSQPTAAPPEMVLLSGGDFHMGNDANSDSSPRHLVTLSPFYLSKCEITNSQYQAFCDETGHKYPEYWGNETYHCGSDYPNHPVIGVTWADASGYAKWQGGRLPSEAEWEYAARGGLVDQNYPNGADHDSTLYTKGIKAPVPVGTFPPNGFGLHDMCGNICEWVSDIYSYDYYYHSPRHNPQGPQYGKFRGIRGGGWHTGPFCSRVAYRGGLKSNWVDFNVGFRIAKWKGESASETIEKQIEAEGVDAAINAFEEMKQQPQGTCYVSRDELNDLGYKLIEADQIEAAIKVFKLTTEEFSYSANAFDSLAEAYLTKGDHGKAKKYYKKAVELNPHNKASQKKLKELE
jgi:formylglycine-generating enzyme